MFLLLLLVVGGTTTSRGPVLQGTAENESDSGETEAEASPRSLGRVGGERLAFAQVPRLSELALRAVGDLAARGDSREKRLAPGARTRALDGSGAAVPWLSPVERAATRRYLERIGALAKLSVHRLLFDSPVDARSKRADAATRTYPGYDVAANSPYARPSACVVLGPPRVGSAAKARGLDVADGAAFEHELAHLRRAVAAVNRLRPPFLVVLGDLTAYARDAPEYGAALLAARKVLARVSESVPTLYAAGDADAADLAAYERVFGSSYYAFWANGARPAARGNAPRRGARDSSDGAPGPPGGRRRGSSPAGQVPRRERPPPRRRRRRRGRAGPLARRGARARQARVAPELSGPPPGVPRGARSPSPRDPGARPAETPPA